MLNQRFTSRFPLLASAISEGRVYLQDGTYLGRAADGVIVELGCQACGRATGDEKSIERYLKTHPTPDTW